MLTSTIDLIHRLRAKRFIQRSRYRVDLAGLPPGLYRHWAHTAHHEFDAIARDAVFFTRAAEALLMFFYCAASSQRPCALPSRAADSVWHAWIAFDPAGLDAFCRARMGKSIAHLENAVMPGSTGQALAVCLVAARKRSGIPGGAARLPWLFVADRELRMPFGYGYRMVGDKVAWSPMDERGRLREHTTYPPSLSASGLAEAGLIASWELAGRPKSDRGDGSGGSSCGSSCGIGYGGRHGGDSRGDNGSASSISESDGDSGGSSCGSGCGGD